MANKTILVTGANGQLGREMQVIAATYPAYNFLFVTREALPIDDIAAVQNYFATHSIDVCVNCAAYTAVDKAEAEIEKANAINGTAVGNLAALCKQYNVLFIHVSTDYVFDGTATMPYKTNHPVSPVNAYGASKLLGEELALKNNPATIIIRTSWVYSSFGNNFVKTMMRLMKDRDSLNVVADQEGCPTYAADLANSIMQIVEQPSTILNNLQQTSPTLNQLQQPSTTLNQIQQPSTTLNDLQQPSTLFHYSNKGAINWHQFAVAIKEISGSNCVVNPIPSSQYPTPAKRPGYSVMDTSKIEETFHINIPEWRDSLQKCMAILAQ